MNLPHDRFPDPGLDRTFRISVVLKGVDGALEILGGLLLLLVSPGTIQSVVHSLTQHELSQDPHDFLASHLLHSTQGLARGTTLFAAIYLLSHGVAKVILVVAVLRDQTWAYPGMIALLAAFIAYQLYRLRSEPTIGLVLLTLFDAFVVVLTWKEYQARHGRSSAVQPDRFVGKRSIPYLAPMVAKRLQLAGERANTWTAARGLNRAEVLWFATAAAVVGVIAVGIAGVCEDVLRHNGLSSTDPSRLMFVIDHRSPWLDHAAKLASVLGSAPLLGVLAVAAAIGLYRFGTPVIVAVAPGVSLCVAAVVAEALKIGVGRARPDQAYRLVAESAPSFPSGHSTDSAAFYLALGLVVAAFVLTRWWSRIASVALAAVAAATIRVSRLVLGVHWPSDVIAGLLIGSAVAIISVAACHLFTTTASRQTTEPSHVLVRLALHTRDGEQQNGFAVAVA